MLPARPVSAICGYFLRSLVKAWTCVSMITGCPLGRGSSPAPREMRVLEGFRVYDVDRLAACIGKDAIVLIGEVIVELLGFDESEMRRADGIRHVDERVVGARK